jgi:tRNA G10  N-methylase Trm11
VQSIAILGRQPAIGLSELESLFGADKVRPVGDMAAFLDVDLCGLPFDRLGGSLKVAKVLNIINTTNWKDIENNLRPLLPEHIQRSPEGKFRLGLSVYGLRVPVGQINATALSFKKIMKQYRNVRVVPNKTPELSTAQVLHNKLAEPTAWELLFIRDGKQTIIAQTMFVQDIEAYAARDQARPKRDAHVGMLPPKLAQILINLAVGPLTEDKPATDITILDPFCGTGVVLQEAFILGYKVVGTDLNERMIEYARENLEWLRHNANYDGKVLDISQADATSAEWPAFDSVATEAYLGRAFSAEPAPDVLADAANDVNTITHKFLQNLAKQTRPGFRACIALPAWKTKGGFKHLKILDKLSEIGYTRQSFVHVRDDQLIYHRPDQIVGRELVVLQRT